MAATLPGTPKLSRLKSMTRRNLFAPPPRWRRFCHVLVEACGNLVRNVIEAASFMVRNVNEAGGDLARTVSEVGGPWVRNVNEAGGGKRVVVEDGGDLDVGKDCT